MKAIVLPVPGVVPPTTLPPLSQTAGSNVTEFDAVVVPERAHPVEGDADLVALQDVVDGTVTEVDPGVLLRMLPEITLPAPAAVPPIVLFGARA